jgi:hypothetical protein
MTSGANGALDVNGIFSTVTTFITTNLLPAIVGLVVLSISIRLGLKAVRKYARA